jgi:hypothetical protein
MEALRRRIFLWSRCRLGVQHDQASGSPDNRMIIRSRSGAECLAMDAARLNAKSF